jgi:SAM-dependent methyltransferase
MKADPRDLEWQRRYEENDAPWDKGVPAPALTAYLREQPIAGRILVPGCGRGHEVRALAAQANAAVVGLDLAETAISQAKALVSTSTVPVAASFIVGDFFRLPPGWANSFDWLVEHTCFCAIDPRQRRDYVVAAAGALRNEGKIFGIFYLDPEVDAGPPFAVSREELSTLFDSQFTLLEEWAPREAFPGREGREWVRIMQKR